MTEPYAVPRSARARELLVRVARTPAIRALRHASAAVFAPAGRAWIRYAPTAFGKHWLFRTFGWRPRRFTSRTVFGMRMRGSTTDLIQRFIHYFGVWEPDITHWMLSRLHPGDAMVDVGANVGYYSLLAASRIGPHGRVVSIEASPGIHAMLDANVRLNGLDNVRTVNAAASGERGMLLVHSGAADNLGQTHTRELAGDEHGVPVNALPLHEILTADETSHARVIKIDVEGSERSVVRGLAPLLSKLREDAEILVEISPELMDDPLPSMKEIFETLRGAGYTAYVLPNELGWHSYIAHRPVRPRVLGTSLPSVQTDVIFSRARY